MKQSNAFRFDLFAVAILLVSGFKFTFALESFMDIVLADESVYLSNGLQIPIHGLPGPLLAPLYSLWYFVLSLLRPDPVSLFYLNYRLLTIAIPLFIYVFLRTYKLRPLAALLVSAYFLISFSNLPLRPKYVHFSLLTLLPFFILASHFRSPTIATLLVSLGSLLSSFVCPNLILSFELLIILYIILLVRNFRQFHFSSELLALLIFVCSSSALIAIFGLPAFAGEADRSFLAFRQHFSVNWATCTDSNLNPWTHWDTISSEHFGNAHSIFSSFVANPLYFLYHLCYNILRTPLTIPKLLFPHYNIIMPITPKIFWIAEGLLFPAVVIAFLLRFKNDWFIGLNKAIQERSIFLLHIALCSIPGLVSCIIIFPRTHYLLLPCTLLISGAALLVLRNAAKNPNGMKQLFTAFIVLSFTPFLCEYNTPGHLTLNAGMANMETINIIRSLSIAKEVRLLAARPGYDIYFGDRFRSVGVYVKKNAFREFLDEQRINMIVVSTKLENESRLLEDDEWHDFLHNYETCDWKRMNIPNTERTLFVKNELLQ
ncbi:MAG: hypothetical protein KAY24_13360 [Candidatus Eisenbacteria sp.]|nr:hypothetical protein [Candidatus Eisenbacteria bacterium]